VYLGLGGSSLRGDTGLRPSVPWWASASLRGDTGEFWALRAVNLTCAAGRDGNGGAIGSGGGGDLPLAPARVANGVAGRGGGT
jgi:hypothetical protein